MEKITVLIPTYNRSKYIKKCLESILLQTYNNLKILIYDDGSNDSTVNIIKNIGDERINLIEGKKNLGPTEARNILLDKCNTKYACWQDSDDLSNIHRIEKQLSFIKKNPNSFITAKHKRISKFSNIFKEIPANAKLGGSFASIFFEVDKNIKFDHKQSIAGEDTRWIKSMEKNGYKKILLPQCLYYIMVHDDRISSKKKEIRKKLRGLGISNPGYPRLSYEELLKL